MNLRIKVFNKIGFILIISFILAILTSSITLGEDSDNSAKNTIFKNSYLYKWLTNKDSDKENNKILLKSRQFTPKEGISDDLRAKIDRIDDPANKKRIHVLIQFENTVDKEKRKDLEKKGVKLLTYIPNNAWYVSIPASKINEIVTDSFVGSIDVITTNDKISPYIREDKIGDWAIHNGTVGLVVQIHEDISLNNAENIVKQLNGVVHGKVDSINALTISIPKGLINKLAEEDVVQWIEEIPPKPIPELDQSRPLIGADIIQASPYNLDGTGVDVLVYDAGGVVHQDFGSRISEGEFLFDDDHATHVAGIVGGDGSLSGGVWRGVAPAVDLVVYDAMDYCYNDTDCKGIVDPGTIESEYDEAINTYGVDIATNSWGYLAAKENRCDREGDYTIVSEFFDQVVRGSLGKRIPVVFSGGNERDSGCGTFNTVNPPKPAKNIIAVGAIHSNDKSMTWFSSFGPVDDGRIKPDLVAPGCESAPYLYPDDINSGDKSQGIWSTIPDRYIANYAELDCDGGGDDFCYPYWGMCGTSMAAPHVTGAIALMLEQFKRSYGYTPLPSTMKAILMQTTDTEYPSYERGFGLINVVKAVDAIINNEFKEDIINNGENDIYYIDVPPSQSELRIVLVWDDYPGTPFTIPELVNDLDLVLIAPNGSIYYPWVLDPANPSNPATTGEDHLNNVEEVYVANPSAGTWQVIVNGYSVNVPDQRYSLVGENFLSGAGDSCKERPITTNIAGQGMPSIYNNKIVYHDNRNGNFDIYMYDITLETETRITSNTAIQTFPDIYQDKIVWHDNRNGNFDIYMYDITSGIETQITTNTAAQRYPEIYGNKIVWQDSRNGNLDIYMYDITSGIETRITTNAADQYEPVIYQDKIVWEDIRNGNFDIYMYDITSGIETRITTNAADQGNPAVWDNKIVYQDLRNGNWEIYMYDITSGIETQITTDTAGQYDPDIYGNKIVWQDYRTGNGDIYMYDLTSGIETQITTNTATQGYPAIYGDKIVWEDNRNGNYDIYMYSLPSIIGITETQITTNTLDQWRPKIYNNGIVWYDYRNGNWDIYMYDITSGIETQLTTDPATQDYPDIYGDKIVWEDHKNGNGDIYMYDITSGIETQLTTDPASQYDPDIYGNKIVWEDYRTGNGDIYMYDITSGIETRITTNAADQRYPAIYQDKIVWWDDRNGNWDIYMYDIISGIETQITTNTADQDMPDIYGTKIVWSDYRNGNYDIYMYDITSGIETQITTDTAGQYFPDIYQDKIVWQDYRNGNADIYMYDLTSGIETQITTNTAAQFRPDIYQDKIVWDDSRNGNYDIYMATLVEGTICINDAIPTAIITSPPDGSVYMQGDAITFTGTASDPEDGTLTGTSLQWYSNIDGNFGSGTSVSISTLTPGMHTITLEATDSGGLTDTEIINIIIKQILTISCTGSTIYNCSQYDSISFINSITVDDTTPYQGQTITVTIDWTGWHYYDDNHWASFLDDSTTILDTCKSFASDINPTDFIMTYTVTIPSDATPGTHNLVVTGDDYAGYCNPNDPDVDAQNFVVINILANTLPSAAITSPTDGSVYIQGDTITFTGTASDAEDGTLTGTSLQWYSNIDGNFGSGASVSISTLSPGIHTITLEATDSLGLTTLVAINIEINPLITPTDDLIINTNTILTPGTYNINDINNDGILIISADNIVLDCNGATIIGTGNGNGIYGAGLIDPAWMSITNNLKDPEPILNDLAGFTASTNFMENVVIKNCNIVNYNTGINLTAFKNLNLHNNNLYDNVNGINYLVNYLSNTHDNNIYNNKIGVFSKISIENNINNNNIYDNTELGIADTNKDDNIFNNEVYRNKRGIISLGEYSNIYNNNAYENSLQGILVLWNTGTEVYNNIVTSNSCGICLVGDTSVNVYNNIANYNKEGIKLRGPIKTGLVNINSNTLEYNSNAGILLTDEPLPKFIQLMLVKKSTEGHEIVNNNIEDNYLNNPGNAYDFKVDDDTGKVYNNKIIRNRFNGKGVYDINDGNNMYCVDGVGNSYTQSASIGPGDCTCVIETEIQITTTGTQQNPGIYENKIVYQDNRNGNLDIYMYDITSETETQITTDLGDQYFLDIYQDKIVWQDNRNGNWDIYMYDLTTGIETQITTNTANQWDPSIYEDKVVYDDYRNGNGNIYIYDLTTGIETQITTNAADQWLPKIYQDKIVWEDYRSGNWDIYMYDLTTGIETQITTNAADQYTSNIYQNRIVYQDNRNGNWDVYMYDITTGIETRITTNVADQGFPNIYQDKILWQDNRNGNWDVYMYDITSGIETQLTTNIADQDMPAIYENKIVWEDFRNGNYDIYMNDLAPGTETQLTTDPAAQLYPKFYNDKIVYQDLRNGNDDIYMYDIILGTETQITTNTAAQRYPDIYQDKIVYQDNRNGNLDIYMYDTITTSETQITTNIAGQYFPDIYQDKIVWQDYRNVNADIYMYDITTGIETRITTNTADQLYPKIYNDKIVYQDLRNGNRDIYMYDITSGIETQITTITADQRYPDIYQDKIVWQDYRNGNADIYMYDITTGIETRITTNVADQWEPKIYNDKIVWYDNRNGNYDIYGYDLTTGAEGQLTTDASDQLYPKVYHNKIVYQDNRNGNNDIYMITFC